MSPDLSAAPLGILPEEFSPLLGNILSSFLGIHLYKMLTKIKELFRYLIFTPTT